jgi:hypothetical protein
MNKCEHDWLDVSIFSMSDEREFLCSRCKRKKVVPNHVVYRTIAEICNTALLERQAMERTSGMAPGEIQLLLPSGLIWTTEKPTKPDWYWYRDRHIHAQIVQVRYWIGYHESDSEIDYLQMYRVDDFQDKVEDMQGEWAGPLERPLEPPVESSIN